MHDFCFVILNYNTYLDTLNCVDSIKKLVCHAHISIVIVDNASTDGSGGQLVKHFRDDSQIHIICSRQNLGFSRGNNLGFVFAKKTLNADYIILCNSDTEILTENFCTIVEEDFKKYNFSLLGPKIFLPNNQIQGFIVDGTPKISDICKILLRINIRYILLLLKIEDRKKNHEILNTFNKMEFHKTLSGCFWIFSKNYIDKFDGLDDRTFMYGEEILLQIRLDNYGLLSLYDPKLAIYHKVGSSVNIDKNSELKKFRFFKKHTTNSLKLALKEIINNK